MSKKKLIIRYLGIQPYESVFLSMKYFTQHRTSIDSDEIWLVEHPSVFTQGQSGKSENFSIPDNIPFIQSDRGGKITFHGPGQQIMYVLLNLRRFNLQIRNFVSLLEQIVIKTLSNFSIIACSYKNAPGVYVGNEKICSIGLRIHHGYSYHGIALNVKMDLTPFLYINPCGYVGLKMTQMSKFFKKITLKNVCQNLISEFTFFLGINSIKISSWDSRNYCNLSETSLNMF